MKTNETTGQLGKKGTEVQVHDAAQVNDAAAAQEAGTVETLEQKGRRYIVVRRKVYLSGPISGYDYEERRMTFSRLAEVMRKVGLEPVNPMENGVPKDADSERHMRADLKMLLECDSIMMLNGWKRSLGARVEHEVALSCGLSVMKESELALRDIYWFE